MLCPRNDACHINEECNNLDGDVKSSCTVMHMFHEAFMTLFTHSFLVEMNI
ncbi:hypothetical protein L798_02291 [Zootermopsis nevadensis]|uniref:Uncharacterized protein n=1 Tax=Zootermopsis nevadensis TaxID=136037 RepID=A0A067RFF1_ZOONE|nr:hypothetical protein L798_02291 [Zootermopsis nevadensis]